MSAIRGKTLAVTGASSGIGRALALELARAGVDLVLNARRSSLLEEVARECERRGVAARAVAGDAASAGVAEAVVEAAHGLRPFGGFVHNAGVLHPGPLLWELPETGFRDVLESNVVAGYQLVRCALPELVAAGGGVAVFVGSGAAETNLPGIGAYAVAKAAEEHLARQVAAEAPAVTAFVYRPGVVETRMQEDAREAEGGGAPALHRVFRGYKEQGVLQTPEQAAAALVRILAGDPRRFHGKVATWQDARPWAFR